MKDKELTLYEVEPVKDFRHLLDMAAAEAGETPAFIWPVGEEDRRVTYREFRHDVRALGTAMTARGLCARHVAVVSENRYEWVNLYLTMLCGTGVFIPVDRELPEEDLFNVLEHSDAEVLFVSRSYLEKAEHCLKQLPRIGTVVCFDGDEDGQFLSYASLMKEGKELLENGDDRYTSLAGDQNEMRMLVYTSGTTGRAKGVMLSENNLLSGVYYGLQVSTVYDRCLSVLPYHHTYEAVCGLLVSLHKHATICINDKIRNVSKNLQRYKPSYIYLVPAFAEAFYKKIWQTAAKTGQEGNLKRLIAMSNGMRKLGIDQRDTLFHSIRENFGGNLRKIVCGGAPIRKEIGEFYDAIGISLVNGYGITECSPLVSANRDDFNDPATAGVILPCLDVTVEEPDEDGNGELCVRGPVVMLGYYKNAEETAKVLTDGVFHTGDFGHVTDAGQIVITGRKKNLIVLQNGKNIFPEELEEKIGAIPLVKEVVVSARTNEEGEELALCAEVYPDPEQTAGMKREEAETIIRGEIAKKLHPLPTYKHISEIVFRETEFEKTTSQKIRRK